MNNWKVILAAVVIFGSGVITGGLLVNHIQHSPTGVPGRNRAAARVVSPTDSGPAAAKPQRQSVSLSKDFLQRLDKELGLSPEQYEAAQKSINEGQGMIRKIIQGSRQDIRDILAPDQQSRFDEMFRYPANKRPAGATNPPAAISAGTTNAP